MKQSFVKGLVSIATGFQLRFGVLEWISAHASCIEPVLAFMETSYEDARTEYFDMLEAHLGELLSGYPEFREI